MLTYKHFSLVDFCSWRIMWLAGSSSLGTVVNQNRLLSVSWKSEGLSVPESDLFSHQKTNVRRSAAFVSIEVSVVRLNGFQEIIQQNAAYTSSVAKSPNSVCKRRDRNMNQNLKAGVLFLQMPPPGWNWAPSFHWRCPHAHFLPCVCLGYIHFGSHGQHTHTHTRGRTEVCRDLVCRITSAAQSSVQWTEERSSVIKPTPITLRSGIHSWKNNHMFNTSSRSTLCEYIILYIEIDDIKIVHFILTDLEIPLNPCSEMIYAVKWEKCVNHDHYSFIIPQHLQCFQIYTD